MTTFASLRLPSGDNFEIEGDPDDLSVFGAIVATGVWEAGLGAFLRSFVEVDHVCIDIGANIGCHTLALAKLARFGRVIAFEADPGNFELLTRNSARLAPPAALIEPVPLAVWDRTAELDLAHIDQLAGCSFVAPGADEVQMEAQIRAVVRNPAMAGWRLDISSSKVAAVRLDDWMQDNPLPRLDLIKIDIEGSERHAISGASETLKRFDPVMITEYNPDCAVTYQGESRGAYFELLADIFADIRAVGPEGSLSDRFENWNALQIALDAGPGWLDLCCRSVRGAHQTFEKTNIGAVSGRRESSGIPTAAVF